MRDRTLEFREFFQTRAQGELVSNGTSSTLGTSNRQKSDFSLRTIELNKQIQLTVKKIQQLTVITRQSNVFDDNSLEINQLVATIKQDLNTLNSRVASLAPNSKNTREIVNNLSNRIANTSQEFKGVLQENLSHFNQLRSRKGEYSSSYQPVMQDSPLYSSSSHQVLELGVDTSYISSRSEAIDSIESTIQELGQIYQNFTSILATQREQLMRLDDNLLDTNVNLENAHSQLVKYYNNMSGNTALMLKVFGVLMFFFLLFMVFN